MKKTIVKSEKVILAGNCMPKSLTTIRKTDYAEIALAKRKKKSLIELYSANVKYEGGRIQEMHPVIAERHAFLKNTNKKPFHSITRGCKAVNMINNKLLNWAIQSKEE